jgi:hypothetical protein
MSEMASMAWGVVLVFGTIFWFHPFVLRFLAARIWARAHALEVGRAAYRRMLAEIEGREARGFQEHAQAGADLSAAAEAHYQCAREEFHG